MSNLVERDWLTIKEAAVAVGVSRETLRRYIRNRKSKLPYYRLFPRGRLRFPKKELTQWASGQLKAE